MVRLSSFFCLSQDLCNAKGKGKIAIYDYGNDATVRQPTHKGGSYKAIRKL